MTLVACTIKSNFPIVVSDIIISNDDVDKSIQLPTNKIDINPYLVKGSKPVRLQQKTYVIKDKVCITLAGQVSEMTEFLQEFKIRCSYYENITKPEIEQFLQDYNLQHNFSNSAFLILQLQQNENEDFVVNQFHYPIADWDILDDSLFDRTYACGTGKRDFLHWMKTISVEWNNKEFPVLQSISINASFIARLLATERMSLHTIIKNWGGSFEMTLFDGESFKKFDNIAYLIYQVYFDGYGNIRSLVPGLVLHHRYLNDTLFISAIEVKRFLQFRDKELIHYISNDGDGDLHVVTAIDRKEQFNKEEIPIDLSFKTNSIGVGFIFITNNLVSPASYYVNDIDTCIAYNGKNIIISLKQEMNNKILNAAMAVYQPM